MTSRYNLANSRNNIYYHFYLVASHLPKSRRQRPQRPDDFMAGDMRVNEQPFLSSMHVLFLREHNRIAKLLKEYLPRSLHKVRNKNIQTA